MCIAVDFNTMLMDPDERVTINTEVAPELVDVLDPGEDIVIFDETLEVEARVELDSQSRRWMARPDWTTSRDRAPVAAMNPTVRRAS